MSPLPFVLFLLAPAAARVPGLESPSTAEACGRCHRAIYEAWSGSAHAKAMESRLFQDALELAELDSGSVTRGMCLGCHAPVAVYKGDLPLRLKVSWEGVTCDYCHSVRTELLISPRDSSGNVEIGLTPDCACATSGGGVRLGHAAVAVADLPGWYDSPHGRVGF